MAEINEVLGVAIEQLERKTEELKDTLKEQRDVNQALAALEEKAEALKNQLRVLTELPVPKDLLDFYVKSSGQVWVSKLRGHYQDNHLEIRHHARILNDDTFDRLPSGAYRFILLIIPQEIPDAHKQAYPESLWEDEYGDRFRMGDC